jgi:pimeloyl-ACP methyl ester carboxylesterase
VPPELHLLPFADMAERADALAGSHLDEGMVRALMALRGCSAEQAKAEVDAMIEQRRPIQEVYRLLSIAAQGRQVIDKSPSYAANIETLRRAERLCNKPRYIHLVRHPYAMIESFTRLRMDRLIGVQGADPFDMAETIWCDMTNNIFELTRSLSEDRDLLVTYEDLVREPQVQIRRITRFLGVDYDPALLDPYSGERMTDGISDRSLSVGDPNFTSRTAIDPVLAEAWRKVELPRDLREETAELARELGYEIPVRRRRSPVQALQMREELVSGFGLELTVCRWGDVLAPAVVCIHGMLEQGSIFAPLAGELVRSGLQVIAPDLRGHGKSDHCAASASYQMADFVADLDAVVSRLESGPVILMGLSLGAAISTLYAAARPERVRDLILVEPPLTRRREPQEVAKILRAQLDESSRRTVDTSLPDFETAIERLLAVYPGMDRALARALAERGTETTLNGSRWRWDWHLRTPAGVGSAAGQEELLGQLQVPHRLVFGRQGDLIQGCDWRAVCNGNLRDIIVLPGGHHLHVEAPEALARLVTDSERWRANEQNQQRNVS